MWSNAQSHLSLTKPDVDHLSIYYGSRDLELSVLVLNGPKIITVYVSMYQLQNRKGRCNVTPLRSHRTPVIKYLIFIAALESIINPKMTL